MSKWEEIMELYIQHHGIKGQRWGFRRFQNEDGSLTPEGRRRYGVDNPDGDYTSATYKKVKAKRLSNKELKSGIQRLQDEKTYNNLVKETNQTGWTKAGNFLAGVATKSTEKALTKALTAVETKYLGDFLKQFGIDISLGDDGGKKKKKRTASGDDEESSDDDETHANSSRSNRERFTATADNVSGTGRSRRSADNRYSTDDAEDADYREVRRDDEERRRRTAALPGRTGTYNLVVRR